MARFAEQEEKAQEKAAARKGKEPGHAACAPPKAAASTGKSN